jgi:outer membrane protein OmpA-like peptidoglycan-associated protein
MRLSQSRATSVADYLRAQGIDSRRFFVQGFGPNYPVADNGTTEGKQLNRRVEITLQPVTQ